MCLPAMFALPPTLLFSHLGLDRVLGQQRIADRGGAKVDLPSSNSLVANISKRQKRGARQIKKYSSIWIEQRVI